MSSFFQYLAIFLIPFSVLKSAWSPEYVSAEASPLTGSKTVKLEQSILAAIKNSWCSEEKAKLIFELVLITRPQVCVEIGAFMGSCTVPMVAGLKHLESGKAYIIDAWSNTEAARGLPKEEPNALWWSQLDMKAIKNQFKQTLASWSLEPYCHVLALPSEQAVMQIPDIDFLHIDGNFSEAGSLLDTQLYVPKVVSGGFILVSNVLVMIEGRPTKMKALWPLFDSCEIICDIDSGNAILFRKN